MATSTREAPAEDRLDQDAIIEQIEQHVHDLGGKASMSLNLPTIKRSAAMHCRDITALLVLLRNVRAVERRR